MKLTVQYMEYIQLKDLNTKCFALIVDSKGNSFHPPGQLLYRSHETIISFKQDGIPTLLDWQAVCDGDFGKWTVQPLPDGTYISGITISTR